MKDRHIGRVRCEVRLEREYMHVVLTAVCTHSKLERGSTEEVSRPVAALVVDV